MKKVKVFLVIMCLAAFSVVNVSALFTEAEALSAPGTEYSAGKWARNQEGDIIGCRCPRLKGPCICAMETLD